MFDFGTFMQKHPLYTNMNLVWIMWETTVVGLVAFLT